MTGEREQHRRCQVLGNVMLREGADQQGGQISLSQSILEIDEHPRAQAQPVVGEQRVQFRLGIRIDQREQVPAFVHVGLNAALFFRRHLIPRPGENEHGGVVRYGRVLQQRQGADVIALFGQRLFRQRQAVAFLVFQAAFAVAF